MYANVPNRVIVPSDVSCFERYLFDWVRSLLDTLTLKTGTRMKRYTLADVEHKLHSKDFFETIVAGVDDWDTLLAQRDDERFDAQWSASYEALLKVPYRFLEDEKTAARIRGHVFKKVLALTGSSEVAGYASDDFGLIMDAALKASDSAWANMMFNSYTEGVFPC
ncbi:hypothetical protein G7Z99_14675 [Pseudomonas entomophila]|uniref:hypothetical protein n=1 Tax=Pseudomonas entomophila TaxID=312306 RepID=UPI0015E2DAA5|nr:hypothetical protein [Pseudomonas entomophila]MBA1190283.1 hypothetical protein [Pseudomonas entomophila]